MSRQNKRVHRLERELALLIVIKIALLMLIWQFFFSANRVDVDVRAVAEHLSSVPQGKYSQTGQSSND